MIFFRFYRNYFTQLWLFLPDLVHIEDHSIQAASHVLVKTHYLLLLVSTCMILALDKKVLEFLQRINTKKISVSMLG